MPTMNSAGVSVRRMFESIRDYCPDNVHEPVGFHLGVDRTESSSALGSPKLFQHPRHSLL